MDVACSNEGHATTLDGTDLAGIVTATAEVAQLMRERLEQVDTRISDSSARILADTRPDAQRLALNEARRAKQMLHDALAALDEALPD